MPGRRSPASRRPDARRVGRLLPRRHAECMSSDTALALIAGGDRQGARKGAQHRRYGAAWADPRAHGARPDATFVALATVRTNVLATRLSLQARRGDAHRLRPSAPGLVGGRVRRARSAPLRVGAALEPAAPPGDRVDPGLGARRDQDVSVPRGGWLCHGCGKRAERSRSARRIRCRPGCSDGTCRRTRARCCGLRNQGRACGGPRKRG